MPESRPLGHRRASPNIDERVCVYVCLWGKCEDAFFSAIANERSKEKERERKRKGKEEEGKGRGGKGEREREIGSEALAETEKSQLPRMFVCRLDLCKLVINRRVFYGLGWPASAMFFF